MVYTVEYRERCNSEVKKEYVIAKNKAEAYEKVVYEILPHLPYCAWVANVTYRNGNFREFNTHEGMRF